MDWHFERGSFSFYGGLNKSVLQSCAHCGSLFGGMLALTNKKFFSPSMFLTSFKFVTALACVTDFFLYIYISRHPLRESPDAPSQPPTLPFPFFHVFPFLFCRLPINKAHRKRMVCAEEPGVVLYPFTVSVSESLWPYRLQ